MYKFIVNNIVKRKVRVLPGSGVNLIEHKFEDYPESEENIHFLFIGRIMKDKGIDELLEAARRIKQKYPNVHFELIGFCEEGYEDKLQELMNLGIIKYHGLQDDVHSFIKNSHAVILPSYHEGMSNALLEAATTGRPVIASKITGCKETFDDGISGLGFEVKNVDSLENTIIKFIELPLEKKRAMGLAGRRKMEKEFNRQIVVLAYIEEIEKLKKNS
jgi:galacturonosyltransferase